jgi:hypothetical protein
MTSKPREAYNDWATMLSARTSSIIADALLDTPHHQGIQQFGPHTASTMRLNDGDVLNVGYIVSRQALGDRVSDHTALSTETRKCA